MRLLRIILLLVFFIILLGGSAVMYIKCCLPKVKVPEHVKVESTPARIERGKYLANYVAVCMDCHSTRDWNRYAGPIVDGTLGKGGEVFSRELGFPGTYYSKNITPAGIGNWSDAEVMRAVVSGVSKDNKALFPIMPYPHFSKMDEEDVLSIIAYIRTLQPIENKVPESESDFPMSIIINTIPAKADFQKRPTDPVQYGAYLTNVASCITCHTKENKGKLLEGLEYAGGRAFPLPGFGTVRSSNITPDPETGIGNWTREAFIKRFKYYTDSAFQEIYISKNHMQTIMPWRMYANMTEDDLGAIYEFLKTVKPVKNTSERFTPEKSGQSEEDREREEEREEEEREKENEG
jgi:hypothetical protein